jgi:RNA polymerase sigma-70 factor, ECF subfamily
MRSDSATYSIAATDMQIAESLEAVPDVMRVDASAWVDEHGDYLFRYAVVRLRDDSLAEDMVQETLLSAIKSISSYEGKSSERTWLTGILKHKIYDHFRRANREVPIQPSDTDLSEFDPLFERPDEFKDHWHDTLSPRNWNRPPDQALQEAEFFRVLQSCMGKLPEKVANVFSLREMDGLDSADICEIMALSPNNFWVMMHRARMALRRCIEINWFIKA